MATSHDDEHEDRELTAAELEQVAGGIDLDSDLSNAALTLTVRVRAEMSNLVVRNLQ